MFASQCSSEGITIFVANAFRLYLRKNPFNIARVERGRLWGSKPVGLQELLPKNWARQRQSIQDAMKKGLQASVNHNFVPSTKQDSMHGSFFSVSLASSASSKEEKATAETNMVMESPSV
eukprot:236652-Ditylum_brightwellii.AAC.1